MQKGNRVTLVLFAFLILSTTFKDFNLHSFGFQLSKGFYNGYEFNHVQRSHETAYNKLNSYESTKDTSLKLQSNQNHVNKNKCRNNNKRAATKSDNIFGSRFSKDYQQNTDNDETSLKFSSPMDILGGFDDNNPNYNEDLLSKQSNMQSLPEQNKAPPITETTTADKNQLKKKRRLIKSIRQKMVNALKRVTRRKQKLPVSLGSEKIFSQAASIAAKGEEDLKKSPFSPRGLVRLLVLTFRRRFLNIFNPSSAQWSNAICRPGDPYCVDTSIIVTSREWRSPNRSKVKPSEPQGSTDLEEGRSSRLRNMINVVSKPVRRVFRKEGPVYSSSGLIRDRVGAAVGSDGGYNLFGPQSARFIDSSRDSKKGYFGKSMVEGLRRAAWTVGNMDELFFYWENPYSQAFTKKSEEEMNKRSKLPEFVGGLLDKEIVLSKSNKMAVQMWLLQEEEGDESQKDSSSVTEPEKESIISVFNPFRFMFGEENKSEQSAVNANSSFSASDIPDTVMEQERNLLVYTRGKETTSDSLKNLLLAGKEVVQKSVVNIRDNAVPTMQELGSAVSNWFATGNPFDKPDPEKRVINPYLEAFHPLDEAAEKEEYNLFEETPKIPFEVETPESLVEVPNQEKAPLSALDVFMESKPMVPLPSNQMQGDVTLPTTIPLNNTGIQKFNLIQSFFPFSTGVLSKLNVALPRKKITDQNVEKEEDEEDLLALKEEEKRQQKERKMKRTRRIADVTKRVLYTMPIVRLFSPTAWPSNPQEPAVLVSEQVSLPSVTTSTPLQTPPVPPRRRRTTQGIQWVETEEGDEDLEEFTWSRDSPDYEPVMYSAVSHVDARLANSSAKESVLAESNWKQVPVSSTDLSRPPSLADDRKAAIAASAAEAAQKKRDKPYRSPLTIMTETYYSAIANPRKSKEEKISELKPLADAVAEKTDWGVFSGEAAGSTGQLIDQKHQKGNNLTSGNFEVITTGDPLSSDSSTSSGKKKEPGDGSAVVVPRNGPGNSALREIPDGADLPLPSRLDYMFISMRQYELAVEAASTVSTPEQTKEFLSSIGLGSLVDAILLRVPIPEKVDRVMAVKGICRLMAHEKRIADEIAEDKEVILTLCGMMEAPMRGFRTLRSQADQEKENKAQREATALIQRMVRTSDKAVESLRYNEQLRSILESIIQNDELDKREVAPSILTDKDSVMRVTKRVKNETNVVEYPNLRSAQMARVALWGMGGVKWKPRQVGQRGLRILSLDGGGTRGVLSIAYLKELMKRVNRDNMRPFEMFDIICGTSTGGIIAFLLGLGRASVDEAEQLYDELIDKIFSQKSNLRLVTEQAAYDDKDWEKILYDLCGDQMLLDSNHYECSRVFCISSKVNNNPPATKVWRNYNYPPGGKKSRYPGACRVNTVTALRSTTAAPTFFTPVEWEGGLYCDGALVANNPTAIALQEAKVLYPGVPVEMVVSIGTGYINLNSSIRTMGWDLLVNQLIASSTATEDVHALLNDFLPRNKYFRFNPLLADNLAIDEKNKSILTNLKRIARDHFAEIERGPDAKLIEQLVKNLRGSKIY